MTDTPEEQAKRNEKVDIAVTTLRSIADDCIHALSNVGDRMSFGNPRLLKGERDDIMTLTQELTEYISGMIVAINHLSAMRLMHQEKDKYVRENDDTTKEIVGIAIHYLRQNRIADALDILVKLHKGPPNQ